MPYKFGNKLTLSHEPGTFQAGEESPIQIAKVCSFCMDTPPKMFVMDCQVVYELLP